MPSLLGHAVAGLAITSACSDGRLPRRTWPLAVFCAVAPDLDWFVSLANLHRANGGNMRMAMKSLGESIAQDLQMAIIQFNDPPDKDITIKRKGFKGGAQATLQDTKVMLRGVAYEVDGEKFPGPVKA